MINSETAAWTSTAARVIPASRRDDLNVSEIDDEGLLFDETTGRTHRLNQTALDVWRLCDGRRSTREIAEELTNSYDVDFDRALDHVEQVLVRLGEAGLLATVEKPC